MQIVLTRGYPIVLMRNIASPTTGIVGDACAMTTLVVDGPCIYLASSISSTRTFSAEHASSIPASCTQATRVLKGSDSFLQEVVV